LNPPLRDLVNIAIALDVSLDELFEDARGGDGGGSASGPGSRLRRTGRMSAPTEAVAAARESMITPFGEDHSGTPNQLWAGVDVGGRRKGFHAATVSDRGAIQLAALASPGDVIAWLEACGPHLVAVDSPYKAALDGETSRAGERQFFAHGICGIRWTPDRVAFAANPTYYEWIAHGLELYAELARAGIETIECFPTASWTRWAGPRGGTSRARWSGHALEELGLELPARRLNQDDRDAIAAALTAREHALGHTQSFGTIVVPVPYDLLYAWER
jgi:predicted nuclease with RNAse H fold